MALNGYKDLVGWIAFRIDYCVAVIGLLAKEVG
jgi:hypothetical protein